MEDLTGSTEVIIFPDVFSKTAPLLKGDEPLFLVGSAEIGDNSAKIIAQEIVTLGAVRQKNLRAVELMLAEKELTGELLEDLKDIVFRYPGNCRLLFKIVLSRKKKVVIEAHQQFNVLPCREFLDEIKTIIGCGVTALDFNNERHQI